LTLDIRQTDIGHKISSDERNPIKIKLQENKELESTKSAFHSTLITFISLKVNDDCNSMTEMALTE
jgi:hypothetical protein